MVVGVATERGQPNGGGLSWPRFVTKVHSNPYFLHKWLDLVSPLFFVFLFWSE